MKENRNRRLLQVMGIKSVFFQDRSLPKAIIKTSDVEEPYLKKINDYNFAISVLN